MRRFLHEAITEVFVDQLPSIVSQAREHDREAVATVTWIVGFSIAVGGFVLQSSALRATLPGRGVLILLILSILSGLAYRLLSFRIQIRDYMNYTNLYASLLGLKGELEESVHHQELDPSWDEVRIVERMKSNYDEDYAFLLEYNASLERCRSIYDDTYRWYKTIRGERNVPVERNVLGSYGSPGGL